ncbi:hypothetical protein CPB86DRAFT_798612 [Serendipita vermifera]|nr:hypothetical protein CPB86DRAFT_798612 [Serendipita vermifera]
MSIHPKTIYDIAGVIYELAALQEVHLSVHLPSKDSILHQTRGTPNVTYEEKETVPHNIDKIPLVLLDWKLQWRISMKHLSFLSPNSRAISTGEGAGGIDLDLWPSLESIQIGDAMVQWSKFSLVLLRKVTIYEPTHLLAHNACTAFLRDIAFNPESYPSLEEITLQGFFEWDILMIMLERRNLLTGSSIKKIAKLDIYCPCPSQLYSILCTLLKCKWPERPSNKELSLAGNAEIILDLSLPGCYWCHRMFRPCKLPVESHNPSDADLERHLSLERLMQYPDNDDEILATWATRAILWDTLNEGWGKREKECSYKMPCNVDVYSLE